MSDYHFSIDYENQYSARQSSRLIRKYLDENGFSNASISVAVNNTAVEFVVSGDISAAKLLEKIKKNNPNVVVTPLGESRPLPQVITIRTKPY